MRLRSYIIRNEFNGAQAIRFAELVGATSLEGIDGVELSMQRATNVDVTELAVLVRMYSHLSASGRQLILSDVPDHIRAEFRKLALDHILTSPAAQPASRPLFARLLRPTVA